MDKIKDQNLQTLNRLDQLGRDIQRFGTESSSSSSTGAPRFESRWSGTPVSPIPSRSDADQSRTEPGLSSQPSANFTERWSGGPSTAEAPRKTGPTSDDFASRWTTPGGASGSAESAIRTPSPAGSSSEPRATFGERWSGGPSTSGAPRKTGSGSSDFTSRWTSPGGESGSAEPSIRTPSPGAQPRSSAGRFDDRWGGSSATNPSHVAQPSPSHLSKRGTAAAGRAEEANRQTSTRSDPHPRARTDNARAIQCIEFVEVLDSGGWFYNRCSQPVTFLAQKYANSVGNDPSGWFTGSSATLAPGARKGIVLGTSQTFQWSACETSDRDCVSFLERLDNDGWNRRREAFCGLLRPAGLTCREAVSSPPRAPSAGPSYSPPASSSSSSGRGPRTYPSSPSGGASR